ncbi:DUF4214 domain-containing protein [Massilia aurea]|uniref:DUF4214 domain-containing protein n=1 Tax=Massilia aurea TaxID=373040 RepID=UPI0034628648
MDINGSENDDVMTSPDDGDTWHNYFGKGGNDTIRIRQGTVIGGAGNDVIELLPSPDWWRNVQAAYWDSPNGVVVDLAGGWAEDGWGTRDTLIGVRNVSGTWRDDRLYGDAYENVFYVGGGRTLADGRAGDDIVWLPEFNEGMALSEFTILASIDGASALVTWSGRPEFRAEITNVERIGVGYDVSQQVADFIQPAQMAREGLLGTDGQRWNAGRALGTAIELTYGFVTAAPAGGPGATGFAAFDEAQRAAVRTILDEVARATGLSFRETPAAGASLRFGASSQDATRGLAAMPGQVDAGQVWMDIDSLRDLRPGSEGYAALLHEIGHALGLRHPRNVEPGDAWSAQWRAIDDVSGSSVMAHGASSDGLFAATWGALDIAALRHLYGSRAVNAGDTSYRLDAARFGAQTSIADDGGFDTIDASDSGVGVEIDLHPGALSSVGVTGAGIAAVDNLGIVPDSWIEAATGSSHDDVLLGNARDNLLRGGLGNDWIDGGAGRDTALFEGRRFDYLLDAAFGKLFVTARDGSSGFDTLQGIEVLQFADAGMVLGIDAGSARIDGGVGFDLVRYEAARAGFRFVLRADGGFDVAKGAGSDQLVGIERVLFADGAVALDLDGAAGKAYRVYQAAFDRVPDAGGLGFWIDAMDRGASLESVAGGFVASQEFSDLYGANATATEFVARLYANVLHRLPDQSGFDFWVGALDRGLSRAGMLAEFSESPENRTQLIGVMQDGIDYAPYGV